MIEKVADPRKIATDEELLRGLAKQGIDKDYVEFVQDYAPRSLGKGHSPYAKFYRDLKSGKRFMVVSGLPKVNAAGMKIGGDSHNNPIVGWKRISPDVFISKPNLFTAAVVSTRVEFICDNDQPDGRKKDDKVAWNPQLFLNGIEQSCGETVLLPTDPTNQFYHDNVLEWDYGICKRRVRLIEGRVLERWVFPANPNGEVRVKHNQTGDYRLKFGQYAINNDEELVPAEAFNDAEYPLEVGSSATYYPDAHEETTSVDGVVAHVNLAGLDWADIVGGAGTTAADDAVQNATVYFQNDANANKFDNLYRGIILFDTSGLPDSATISAAVLSLYSLTKGDGLSATPDTNIYKSTPFANTALQADDFVDIGTVALSNVIAYAAWNTGDPGTSNDFALADVDTDGFGYIPVAGVCKLGIRNANYDVADELDPGNHTPPYVGEAIASYFYVYFAEKGTGYKPKLVVTYTAAYIRAASVLVGNLTTATKAAGDAYHRTSSTLVGALVSAVRVYGRVRASAVIAGIVASATRGKLTATRASSVICGIVTTAKRNITKTISTASVLIGVVVTATRNITTLRVGSVILGIVTSTVLRSWGRIRASSVIVGNLVTATRGLGTFTRTATTVLVGNLVTASRKITVTMPSASVLVGVLATATKKLAIDRDSSVIVGIVATTKRLYLSFTRASSVLVGNLVAAVVQTGVQRAIVYIGVYLTANRNITKQKAASVIIGITVTAIKGLAYTASAAVIIGVAVTAITRMWGRIRASSVLIGNKVTASRKIGQTIVSSVIIGMVVAATRGRLTVTRKAAVKVGILVSAFGLRVGRLLKMVVFGRDYRDAKAFARPYYDMEVSNDIR